MGKTGAVCCHGRAAGAPQEDAVVYEAGVAVIDKYSC